MHKFPPIRRHQHRSLTVTETGELTNASGLDGKGFPGSTDGRVGPKPVTNTDRISPAAAGFDALTSVKSLEWTIAGAPLATIICGTAIGISCARKRTLP